MRGRSVPGVSSEEDSSLLVVQRRLFEVVRESSTTLSPVEVDWDSYLSVRSSGRCHPMLQELSKGVRALCSSGLEAIGRVPVGSVREVLKRTSKDHADTVLRMLRSSACSDWITFSSDETVEFPMRVTAAEVIARIFN